MIETNLTYKENGILKVVLKCKKSSDLLLKAGNSDDLMPTKAVYKGERHDLFNLKCALESLDYKYIQDKNEMCVLGGYLDLYNSKEIINPINRLAIALRKIGYKSNVVKFIADEIGEDINISKVFPNCKGSSEKLIFNIYKIDLNQAEEKLYVNIEMPSVHKKEDTIKSLVDIAQKYNLEYEQIN